MRPAHAIGAHRRTGAPLLSAHASPRRVLAAIFSSSLGVGLIFGFQPPLIALTLSRAGASSFVVGAVTSASLVAVILLGPVYPRVIARFGLRGCIVLGVGVGALILLLMAARREVPVWLVLRLASGCVLGLAWIASEIWMNEASDDASRGAVMGVYGTVFSLGVVLGPALLEITGTQGARPFVCGALCLLATLVPLMLLPGVQQSVQPERVRTRLARTVRFAPVVMLAAWVAGLVESADLALLPLFGLHAGLDERAALLLVTVFMAGNVILQTPIGLLADRIGRRAALALCAASSALGPMLLPRCIHEPFLLAPLLFVWGGTLYAFYSQGVALMGEEFPSAELAAANTVFVMVYCLGGILGPSLGGWLMDRWPVAGLPAFLSAAPLLLLLALLRPRRR
ncbi:MAG TPA: MFS transporter [Steroidobacteraceae bacterium]|nr:MFS transporter [Steroidobacteraceae bacterium]